MKKMSIAIFIRHNYFRERFPGSKQKKGLFPGIISRDDPIGAKNHVKYHAQIKL